MSYRPNNGKPVKTTKHGTPDWLMERIRHFLGPEMLDPFPLDWSPETHPDGFDLDWSGQPVYLNPPYDHKTLARTFEKVVTEQAEFIALVPAKLDQPWFQDLPDYDVVGVAIRGRLKYLNARAGAQFPSVLLYGGFRCWAFMVSLQDLGRTFRVGGGL